VTEVGKTALDRGTCLEEDSESEVGPEW
jgi:hypothetical protein